VFPPHLLRNSPARALLGGIAPGGAVNGPTARALGGPAAEDYETRLAVAVYERDGTLVAELPDSFGRSFTRRLDGTGAGRLTLAADDPAVAQLTYARVARFTIDGRARCTILIRAIDTVAVGQGEEADELVQVVGPDWFAVLEEGLVGPGSAPVDNPDVRPFTVSTPAGTGTIASTAPSASGGVLQGSQLVPDPPAASWPDPVQLLTDVPATPANFPVTVAVDDTEARWITATPDPGSSGDPLYAIERFTVVDADLATLVQVGASGPASVYVDGTLVQRTPKEYQRQMLRAELQLAAGDHTLEVRVDQPADVTKDPATIARVSQLDADAKVAATLTVTSPPPTPGSTTSGARRSSTPPARLTAGGIVGLLCAEAQTRGCFPALVISFDADVDTEGNPWPTVEEFSASVGEDTVASVCKKLTEAQLGWFRMAPGQMRLDGYATLPSSSVATLAAGVDLTELKHEGAG